jgi:sarcosine oxidase subunit beta
LAETTDAIIIGAGIIGTAVALELTRKGFRTLNIDKLPAAGYGSTSSSSAGVRTHYSTWDGVAIAYESHFYWKHWKDYVGAHDETGPAELVNTGGLVLGYPSDGLIALFDDVGVAYELWDVETLRKEVPVYSPMDFSPPRRPEDERFFYPPARALDSIIYTPSSGYVRDAQRAAHNLQRAAEALGGRFWLRREVTGIRRSDSRVSGVVLRGGEEVHAPVVVNAAGPHSFLVNRMAGVGEGMRIGTRPLRHEVHAAPSPPEFDFGRHGLVTSDFTTATYHMPEAGGAILVGSQDPPCDPQVWIDDPDHFDRQATTDQWKAQVYRLALRIPELPIPNRPTGLADLYDVSDDWIPVYDKSDLEGYYMAVGTSGNQFKNAPMAGRLMAELIEACENGQDHDADPVRVRCAWTGHVLDVGFYSRRREANRESSFSVVG